VKLALALLWTSIGLQLMCSFAIFALEAPGSAIEALDATGRRGGSHANLWLRERRSAVTIPGRS
jgi:hypothetical protein